MKNRNKYILQLIILIVLLLSQILFSQIKKTNIEKHGTISFQSSQNIYVNFSNTDGIKPNDTLYVKEKNKLIPVIRVKYISAASCAGESIGLQNLNKKEDIIAFVDGTEENKGNEIKVRPFAIDTLAFMEQNNISEVQNNSKVEIDNNKKYVPDNNLKGRFSVQSISSLENSGSAYDVQRWRYSFYLNKNEFIDSKLSFSNYMVFAYTANEWSDVKTNLNKNLKIYDLTLSYNPDDKTTFWLGRHLNNKIGNIGASDGLQIERQLGSFYAGFIIGSRPDYNDYSYNIKLFQYGGYIAKIDKGNGTYVENVLGAFQQTNNMKTDRRFLYFQHSNNLITNTNFFFSTEIDLYKKDKNIGKTDFNLTSLYMSLRVAPGRAFSFTTTYDARRNVIYYETYKFLIDTLFQNELRQGLRFSTNIRPFNKLFLGLNAGYRFKSGDISPSKNYGGYLSYSSSPIWGLTPSISFTKIISSYVDGTDFGGKLNKYLYNNIDLSLGYRKLTYKFTSNNAKIEQDIFTTDLSILLIKNLSLSINYEGVFENSNTFSRFFIDLTTRF
ncbi:MAG TPA: hypothetical protein VKA26_03765 [Ignavibacteriaceae bacterium]|nr:hypothetical protein [Ignavibacteriaceae bacterium]